jgi:AraC family transcriptional regulator
MTPHRAEPGARRLATRERTRADHTQRVLRVLVQIRTRLGADLSLDRLARTAHFSPMHFQRVFAQLVGESPKRHVQRLRLERAAQALRNDDAPIATVAEDAGYIDVPTFYRAFRTWFGSSPIAWRERARRRQPPRPMPAAVQRWLTALDADSQLQSVPHAAARAPAAAAPAVRRVQLPVLRVAFVMRRGTPAASDVAQDFARLLAFAARRAPVDDPLLLRIHHDDPAITPAPRCRIDHAIVVGPRRRGDGDIGIATVGRTHALVATCAGAGHVAATRRWLEKPIGTSLGARRSDGPVLEVLLDPPGEVPPSSARALRDVLVPVAPFDLAHPSYWPWYWRRRRPAIAPADPTSRSRRRP